MIYYQEENIVKYIEHNNITLRKAKTSDLKPLFINLWSSGEVAKYLFWEKSNSLENATERLDRTIKYQSENNGFVVALKSTGEAIGITGVVEYEPLCYRESGLCIGEQFQGFGYGKEMLEMLLYLVFVVLKGNVFRYSCVSENIRSKNLCLNYGFEYKETLKEVRKWDNKEFNIDYFYLTKEKYFKEA